MSKILIIDDEKVIVEMLSVRLKKSGGYDAVGTVSGEEGIELAKKEKPDLILLDVMMPRMDGCEIIKELKKDPSSSAIPVIMLTASNSLEMADKAMELGAADYMTKPFDPQRLLEKIKQQLERTKKS